MATSIIMMAFFLTMPISRMMPMKAITENGVPKIEQRQGRADAGGWQCRENGDRMDGVLVENAEYDIDRRRAPRGSRAASSPLIARRPAPRPRSCRESRPACRDRCIALFMAAVAWLNEPPGGRLNEIVAATSPLWWLT